MTLRHRIWAVLTIIWGAFWLLVMFGSIYFIMWYAFAPLETSTP